MKEIKESKGKMGWRVVKSKEIDKIDSWKEVEEESGNIGLAYVKDCNDQNYM
jgi:hypothetical protein